MRKKWGRWVAASLAVALSLTAMGCNKKDPTENPAASGSASSGGSEYKKKIAFTFDDGPHAPAEDRENGLYPYTTYVLDKVESLQRAGHKANVTFFVVGSRAHSYPHALKRAALLGCDVGSHTYEHSSFVGASNETISRVLNQASESISAAGVSSPRFFRPVGGAVSESQLNYISSLGYITIGWSIDTNDWNGHPKTSDKFSSDPEKKAAYEAFVQEKVNWILEKADDGDIILMHDIYMSSVDIFIRAADALIERGFELVTVSEILGENILTQSRPVMYISRNEYLTHMD